MYSALHLKKRGYKDVTIFEKSDRVGGKSNNVEVNGASYPQGSIFVTPDYFDNIVPLAREYDAGDLVEQQTAGFWTTNSSTNGSYLSRSQYALREISKFTNSQDPLINAGFLVIKVIKYIR